MTRPPRPRGPRQPAPVEPPPPPRHTRKHLTVDEWRRLRAVAAEDPRTHALILLIYEAGLRREEPGQMRLSFLDKLHEKPPRIYVWRQKKSLSGWVEVSAPTAKALSQWVEEAYPLRERRQRDSFVFPGGRRRGAAPIGLTGRTVYNLYKDAANRADLPPDLHHPHVLKASRVQHLLEHMTQQGLDPWLALQSLAAIVGHSTAQTTIKHYIAETSLQRARVLDYTKKMTGE